VRVPERPVAGGAFVAPLPSAVPAKTSSTPSDPAAGSTDGTAAAGDPQTQNPVNTGGEPPA
jgi:hypothetical protein